LFYLIYALIVPGKFGNKDATIKAGHAFYGSRAKSAKEDVEKWLKDR
jgi:hypothetical protein